MPRKSIEERLAQLDAQKKSLQARLSTQERARDTRRKILMGSFILQRLEDGGAGFVQDLQVWLGQELPAFLTREQDKAIFGDLLSAKP